MSAAGLLAGVRIVDLTHHLGGPLATMYLARLGADLVKVEPPEGDEWRRVDDVDGESRPFHAVNRDKLGFVLDLRAADGREVLGRLVDGADVFVHSLAPGVVERLGVSSEDLCARNPRLVYCGLSAFGPELVVGPPLRLSRAPARTARAAPRLGEHTTQMVDQLTTEVM
jgi:crotonobetainyl-CoA:carnitine CoA-transferase CaiB-like acyl-CoA transferase